MMDFTLWVIDELVLSESNNKQTEILVVVRIDPCLVIPYFI